MQTSIKRILIFVAAMIVLVNAVNAKTQTRNDRPAVSETERLSLLCKVWGFLKYYHPSVGTNTMNWDSVLVLSVPKVKAAKSAIVFEKVLTELTTSAGEIILPDAPAAADSLATHVNWNWIKTDIKDASLKNILQAVLLAGNGGKKNKYVSDQLPDGRKLGFARFYEAAFKEMILPDYNYRMLGLFRFWNIINYFSPYLGLMDHHWEKTLSSFIPVFGNATDSLSYHLAVKSLAAAIDDGHAFAYSPLLNKHFGTYSTPFEINYVEGKYIIGNALSDSLFVLSKLNKGDIIVAMHGQPLHEMISYLRKYSGGSNMTAINGKELPGNLVKWRDTISSITVLRAKKRYSFPYNSIHRKQ